MNDNHQKAVKLLGSLHALTARTDAAERRIEAAARERERAVIDRMKALRQQALTDPGAAAEYQTLALERRRLSIVIETARANLG